MPTWLQADAEEAEARRIRLYRSAMRCSPIELMEKQRSEELEGADFQAFNGRKKSWQELAQGCITYMARLLVQLRSVQDVKERADLLHHRLVSNST